MTKRFSLALIALVALAMLILPASAALNQIAQGGDVFIGEEGLDVTIAVGGSPQIAWFASGTVPATDTPNFIIAVGTPTSFYVAPADYIGRTGNWFRWNGTNQGVAFNVVDPNIDIRVRDQNGNRDVTGKSVVAGAFLNFRIETNTNSVVNRPGYAGEGFVTIKVKAADGSTYTALWQTNTDAVPAIGIPLTLRSVNTIPWYWVPAGAAGQGWNTLATDAGSRLYRAGTYTVSAELILNKIKDNYKAPDGTDFTGKTVTALRTVAITSDTVKIEASKDTVVRGNQFSVTVTGRPNTPYFLWLKGTSGMTGGIGDQPPLIRFAQDSVALDPVGGPYTIGSYVFEGGAGRTIRQDVPNTPNSGIQYYAQITTSSTGTRTVGFLTGEDTNDKKYTIRVENNFDGQFRSDEVNVNVEQGTVTIVAAGDQSYFLGQEVRLSGTNSETDTVFLFITGPNLPSNGGLLTDPRTPVNPFAVPPTFTTATVNDDNTWEFRWQTANLNIDAGTYTITAASTPSDRSQLAGTQFGIVSVILRKPFVTGQVSQSTVAQGDSVYIRGVAEGQPSQGVAVWVMGRNYAERYTESVMRDGTFEFEHSGALTSQMTSGQYFVVVQHPMFNDLFDVIIGTGDDANYVVGAFPTRWSRLFALFGPGSLQGSDAANALTLALDNAAIDDTYLRLQFLVEVPEIRIVPVPQKMVGDSFDVRGTTNLAVDNDLLIEIYSSSFGPTPKEATGEFFGASGTVKVTKGTEGFNTWSFPVDTTLFAADEYIVKVTAIGLQTAQDVTATTLFTVVDFVPTTVPTTVPPTTPPVTTRPTTVPTTVPTTTPGFGALVALIGLGAVAFLIVRKH